MGSSKDARSGISTVAGYAAHESGTPRNSSERRCHEVRTPGYPRSRRTPGGRDSFRLRREPLAVKISIGEGGTPAPNWPEPGMPTHCACDVELSYRHIINELWP